MGGGSESGRVWRAVVRVWLGGWLCKGEDGSWVMVWLVW